MGLNLNNIAVLKHRYPTKYDNIPIGAKVRAIIKVKEGNKEREQVFEGVIIKRNRGKDTNAITIRKVSFGVGVERTIPLDSKDLVDIQPVTIHKVRRSRLYYLRNLKGNAAKLAALYGISQDELKKRIAGAEEEDQAMKIEEATAAAAKAAEAQPETKEEPKAETKAEKPETPKKEAAPTEEKPKQEAPAKEKATTKATEKPKK